MMRNRLILGALAMLAIAAMVTWRWSLGWHPDAARFPIQGLTVAASDGAVDWGMVRARGADFAFVVPTTFRGETLTRFAVVNPHTTKEDVTAILDTMA